MCRAPGSGYKYLIRGGRLPDLVLNVDDSSAIRYARTRWLRGAGIEVIEAGTGESALDLVARFRPGVISLDVCLPDMSGFEVCRRIKAMPGMAAAQVLHITASAVTAGDLQQGLEYADSYLFEPVAPEILVAHVKALLRTHNALADAERRAREAEEGRRILDALMEYIPEGITVADAPDVRIRMVSRYGAAMTGRPLETLRDISVEAHVSRWDLLAADGETPARNEDLPLSRAVLKGEVTQNEEVVLRRPDGRKLHLLCNAGPIRDRDGRITGGLIAWRDITDRKRMEERLREAQRRESIVVLAGGLAHDFNNLLTAIQGSAALALDGMSPADPNYDLISTVVSGSEKAADLTRQLLAYAGQGRFVLASVDLSATVQEMVQLLRPSIPAATTIELDLDGALPAIETDPSQLQQVVTNLLVNASEAIGKPPGAITVRTRVEAVSEADAAQLGAEFTPGRYVRLEVSDTGCGMDDRVAERIFDPFFTTKFMGRGLGLAAVLGIIKAHKGAVRVASRPGKGSTFSVYFPAPAAPEARGIGPPAAGETVRDKITVLVVDDEEAVREFARKALQRYGHRVLLASNGREAVEIFIRAPDRVSLVLLDLTMPLVAGEETLRHLQAIRPDVRVLLSSGYNETDVLPRFAGKRLAGFLGKPYTAAALAREVKRICSAV